MKTPIFYFFFFCEDFGNSENYLKHLFRNEKNKTKTNDGAFCKRAFANYFWQTHKKEEEEEKKMSLWPRIKFDLDRNRTASACENIQERIRTIFSPNAPPPTSNIWLVSADIKRKLSTPIGQQIKTKFQIFKKKKTHFSFGFPNPLPHPVKRNF